ncbi:IS21-like element helper ATPase IstB [Streptomyces sp. NPDC056580]|uniref:IS21-like element helper ATPase IstB n=1 Tax=Streptomyces sp. NPDC056580 TaxID=3345872 RepID=UPI003690882F
MCGRLGEVVGVARVMGGVVVEFGLVGMLGRSCGLSSLVRGAGCGVRGAGCGVRGAGVWFLGGLGSVGGWWRGWPHEEYLAVLLQRRVADRESKGTAMRIRTARFPQVKTLEDFNLEHLPSLRRDVLAHLATGTFVAKAENVVLLGPPGIGKTHLAIGFGVKAAHAGYSVLFGTASNWISRLAEAHHSGRLEAELEKIRRYKLIIIDEVGCIPFDQDAANLFFEFIASRYEQGSVMVTSNLPFGRWGETFSDDVVAAAMIDRLVHHAEVLTLTGDSCRTRVRRELLAQDRAGRE